MNYARIYEEFIQDRKTKFLPEGTYTEKHHIKPRCLGGGDESENIIRLTAEDHIFAHLILAHWLNTKSMWAAIKFIFGQHKRVNRVPTRREIRAAAKAKEGFAKRNSGENNYNYGKPMSEEQKERLRVANTGKVVPPHVRQKISEAQRGRTYPKGYKPSEETRRKMSIAITGKRHTEETKARMSQFHTGKTFSDETRKKISDSRKGQKSYFRTPEMRAAAGARIMGRIVSDETRDKIRAAKLGTTVSQDARNKMSEHRTGGGNSRAKPVIVVSTNERFSCMKDAAEALNISHSTIRAAISRGKGSAIVFGIELRLI